MRITKQDACRILGVKEDSSSDEVRSSYKRLALKWHPDKHGDSDVTKDEATQKFQEVSAAYKRLTTNANDTDDEIDDSEYMNIREMMELFAHIFFHNGVRGCPHHGMDCCDYDDEDYYYSDEDYYDYTDEESEDEFLDSIAHRLRCKYEARKYTTKDEVPTPRKSLTEEEALRNARELIEEEELEKQREERRKAKRKKKKEKKKQREKEKKEKDMLIEKLDNIADISKQDSTEQNNIPDQNNIEDVSKDNTTPDQNNKENKNSKKDITPSPPPPPVINKNHDKSKPTNQKLATENTGNGTNGNGNTTSNNNKKNKNTDIKKNSNTNETSGKSNKKGSGTSKKDVSESLNKKSRGVNHKIVESDTEEDMIDTNSAFFAHAAKAKGKKSPSQNNSTVPVTETNKENNKKKKNTLSQPVQQPSKKAKQQNNTSVSPVSNSVSPTLTTSNKKKNNKNSEKNKNEDKLNNENKYENDNNINKNNDDNFYHKDNNDNNDNNNNSNNNNYPTDNGIVASNNKKAIPNAPNTTAKKNSTSPNNTTLAHNNIQNIADTNNTSSAPAMNASTKSDASSKGKNSEADNNRILLSHQIAVQGNQMAQTGDFLSAVKMFTKAISLDSTDFRFFGNRSYCYDRIEQYDIALVDANAAIKLSPEWPKGYFRKGRALNGLKRFQEAEQVFQHVLKLDPVCEDAQFELARVRVQILMDMGFNQGMSEQAVRTHGTVQQALEALLAGKVEDEEHSTDVYFSEDEDIIQNGSFVENHTPNKNNKKPIASKAQSPKQQEPKCTALWVGNVDPQLVTEKQMSELFSKCGKVASVRILPHKYCAFVNYCESSCATMAMNKLQGATLGEQKLLLRFPNNPPPGSHIPEAPAPKSRISLSESSMESNKLGGPVNGNECYFWRTTGCVFEAQCRYKHVREHKGVDLPKVQAKYGKIPTS